MTKVKLALIPGRSLKQGTGLNWGKNSAEYQLAVSTLEICRQGLRLLPTVLCPAS